MSIAIEFTETFSEQKVLGHPVIVDRPKVKTLDKERSKVARPHASSASDSASETKMFALQLVGTFITLAACSAAVAISAWILLDSARSAMDQLLVLSPNQILQGMAGR